MLKRIGLAGALFAAAALASANTYTVTSTADSGAGTLRQAILDANANPGADTIAFAIVGSGVQTIAPASALPAITGPVTIDGYTQSGSSANTLPTSQGLDTVLRIEIDGTSAGASSCFSVQADDVTIRGLAINRFTHWDVTTVGAHQNLVVEGCFLGTNTDGTQALGAPVNGGGIYADSHQNLRIGGTTPAARNLLSGGSNGSAQILLGGGPASGVTATLIAGNLIGTDVTGLARLVLEGGFVNLQYGTNNVIGGTTAAARNVVPGLIVLGTGQFGGTGATGNFVRGNFVGTDVTGTVPLGCSQQCIQLYDQNNTIGGAAAGAGSRIGGAGISTSRAGIFVQASGSIIQGNFIGTDETGTIRLPNRDYGIWVNSGAALTNITIGGIAPGEGNLIASNGGLAGVGIQGSAAGVTVRGNSIFDNPGANATNGLGIDLVSPGTGVTFNDAGDGDTGPNGLQNHPILSSVTYGASTTTVAGTLNSTAATIFDVDFYADPICSRRPQDLPEGKTYLGTSQVTTDGSGNASLNVILPVAIPAGSPVTATATDPGGNTSEFSPRFVLTVTPPSGPPGGAAGVVVKGLAFEDGATASVGGVAATDIVVQDPHTLTMRIPALPAGSINPVFVQNPGGGLSGTLPNGWIADFLDVGSSNQFYFYVTRLVANGITAGIGGGLYGQAQSTKRQQMAVFLLKGKYGVCYVPPPCNGDFADVTCPSTFANWIEALADEGITGGCGGNNFCPANPVRRDQMAAFLLKAKHGSTYVPPPCDGDFGDVACPSLFANWIEQLAAEGITGGCGGGNYCPLTNATRGQMAAFLVNTFSLP